MNIPLSWMLLNQKPNPICDEVVRGFSALLSEENSSESAFQDYIEKHCAFFFPGADIALGKIAMKNVEREHITDFVIAYDDGSAGFIYELIEIEAPSKPAFTQAGNPSQYLSHAKRQIADWRTWLKKYSDDAYKLFPSKSAWFGEPKFHYTIYMDRRSRLANFGTQRAQQESEQVSLRSFDRLLDNAKKSLFLETTNLHSAEENRLDDESRRELANPFRIAYSDSEWNSIRTSPGGFNGAHSVANNAPALLENRRLNTVLHQQFLDHAQRSSVTST